MKDIIFSLTEAVGALAEALKIFKEYNVNLVHIESRSSERVPGYEFMVEVFYIYSGHSSTLAKISFLSSQLDSTVGDIEGALKVVQDQSSYFQVITRNILDNPEAVPWFPRKIQDLENDIKQLKASGGVLPKKTKMTSVTLNKDDEHQVFAL